MQQASFDTRCEVAALNRRVTALRAGLKPRIRSRRHRQLAHYTEIDLQHLDGWVFGLLPATVVVLDLEGRDGQKGRSMPSPFSGG